jgi:hypothetical protein
MGPYAQGSGDLVEPLGFPRVDTSILGNALQVICQMVFEAQTFDHHRAPPIDAAGIDPEESSDLIFVLSVVCANCFTGKKIS